MVGKGLELFNLKGMIMNDDKLIYSFISLFISNNKNKIEKELVNIKNGLGAMMLCIMFVAIAAVLSIAVKIWWFGPLVVLIAFLLTAWILIAVILLTSKSDSSEEE
jgi:hypothetical protein